MAIMILLYLVIICICCVPSRDDGVDVEGQEKTCKNCIEFDQCDMWNYSYFPCVKWEPVPESGEREKDGPA